MSDEKLAKTIDDRKRNRGDPQKEDEKKVEAPRPIKRKYTLLEYE